MNFLAGKFHDFFTLFVSLSSFLAVNGLVAICCHFSSTKESLRNILLLSRVKVLSHHYNTYRFYWSLAAKSWIRQTYTHSVAAFTQNPAYGTASSDAVRRTVPYHAATNTEWKSSSSINSSASRRLHLKANSNKCFRTDQSTPFEFPRSNENWRIQFETKRMLLENISRVCSSRYLQLHRSV